MIVNVLKKQKFFRQIRKPDEIRNQFKNLSKVKNIKMDSYFKGADKCLIFSKREKRKQEDVNS
jgi:DNA-binding MltR family transcriptional regulator